MYVMYGYRSNLHLNNFALTLVYICTVFNLLIATVLRCMYVCIEIITLSQMLVCNY